MVPDNTAVKKGTKKMAVPFLDLKAQYLQIKNEVKPEIEDVLETCYYVLGPKVKNFEEKFAELCGVKHCVALSSGTAAVHGMIWATELPAGSGIITPPNTFTATAEGIILAGHVPVFVDADPVTWNLSAEKTDEFLKSCSLSGKPVDPKTGVEIKGIVAVDLYGQAAN
ncbi:MAG: DegT/DnrJ/EryC1/StrS aminotransferase family protein, partial [Candidatus Fermentibacteraceae bacterium]|nr:DegT/DnrJ/EryC1/StrS aminotransferase family protein [Candidatus Fermentibacteraceae bacterium]